MAKKLDMDFAAADSSGYKPDMTLLNRRYKHQNGKNYFIGGFSFDADRQRWMIGYQNPGCPVVFMRLPEEFFGLRNGRPRFIPVQ